MKTDSKLIVLILMFTSVFFGSCEKDFLEEVPTEDIASETATETTENLFLVVNGIHRSLYLRYGSNRRGGVGAFMMQVEALGEDYVMTARGNNRFINFYKWIDNRNASDTDNLFVFSIYYRIIRNANTVINGADLAAGPVEQKNAAVGQALTYRAWAHFQLVQLYAKRYVPGTTNSQLGIPISLLIDQEAAARPTVEAVYTQINQDLDDAIIALEGYVRPNKSHFDKSVAQGLKARVALVQGNYAIAATYAEDARAGYTLMSTEDYFNNFSNYESDEWMWGSHEQEDQGTFFASYGSHVSRNFSSNNIRNNPKAINSTLYSTIPDTDVRKSLFDPTGLHLNLPTGVTLPPGGIKKPFTSQKFIAAGTDDSRMDIPLMRVSEMYLIEAEAKARLSDLTAANVLFEYAIVRDPSYTISTNTGTALIDEILLQRRWELWGEGFRFYDLKRMDLPLNRNGANHISSLAIELDIPAGDNRWQWLIPQDAINANSLLKQND